MQTHKQTNKLFVLFFYFYNHSKTLQEVNIHWQYIILRHLLRGTVYGYDIPDFAATTRYFITFQTMIFGANNPIKAKQMAQI